MTYTALKDLYYVERFVLRWMICTALNDIYYVEWFILRWMIYITLNDLYYVRWVTCTTLYNLNCVAWFVQCWIICSTAFNYLYYVEWFVFCWMICVTLNDLYNIECFFTSLQNLCDLERFVQRWQICTTLNDSECDGWFVQRWIIWATMNYWVSAFYWKPGVLIRKNIVRYFAQTSELIFSWFGIIKKKYFRLCPRNWSQRDVFDQSSGNYCWCIFQTYLTTSWTNLTLHFLTWCNYAAQLHPSLGKVKGKGKISPDQWMEKLKMRISPDQWMDWKFSKFWTD